jgi:hypothetical protein
MDDVASDDDAASTIEPVTPHPDASAMTRAR